MQNVVQDLRFGLRALRRRPGLSLAVVFTLALGIGGTTAVFSLLHGVLLRPLAFPEAERLVQIHGEREAVRGTFSGPEYEFLVEHGRSLEAVAASSQSSRNLTGAGEPERVLGVDATPSLFPLLGARPLLGRLMEEEEAVPGSAKVALLSEGLWRRRYGADPEILGRTIEVDGEETTVIGVLPASFRYPAPEAALWVPMVMEGDFYTEPGTHFLTVIGRLAPGVSLAAATEHATAVQKQAEAGFDSGHRSHPMGVTPLADVMLGSAKPGLLILQAAVATILLICCVNVANLLLVAGQRRQKELVLRKALGANRKRLLSQLLVESLLLASVGGVLGLLLAPWALDLLVALSPGLPRLEAVEINGPVLFFTAATTLVCGLLFGLFPAFRATRADLRGALAQGATVGRGQSRDRSLLVVLEVALSVTLLVAAGLLARSFWTLLQVDPGFDAERTVSLSLSLPDGRYGEDGAAERFVREALESVEALPQVESAAMMTLVPLSGSTIRLGIELLGPEGSDEEGDDGGAVWRAVTPKLFPTLGIPILRGRAIAETDRHPDAPPVAVISDALARRHWPDSDPVGSRMIIGYNDIEVEIVGVAADLRHQSLEQEPLPEIYTPFEKTPWHNISVVTRLEAGAAASAPTIAALRNAVWAVDPEQPIFAVRPMSTLVDDSLAPRRSLLLLLAAFAAMALALAAVGIYAVVATSVAERTREVGIRKALGAQGGDLIHLLLAGGLKPVVAGVALGLAAAALGHRLITSQLYGVAGLDPLTYLAMALTVTAVAATAIYLPAHRASRVDPLVALRYE